MCQPGRPGAPRARQDGSPGLAAFHSAKSSGLLLLLADLDARARLEIVDALPRQLAVVGEAAAPRSRRRRRPRRPGPCSTRRWMMSMTSAMCSVARGSTSAGATPERAQVGVHLRRCTCAPPRRPVPLLGFGLADDLVVDVGDVADEADREAAGAQVARDDVERDHHARVADVAEVVDRDAAAVHADLAGHERLERDLLARAGVVDSQRHRRALRDEGGDVEDRRTSSAPAR